MAIIRVVLTGSDQSGKSAGGRNIADEFGEAVVVPEIATALINGGFPSVPDMLPWSQEWQDCLQRTIYHAQLGFEQAYEMYAANIGALLLLLDRGLADGIAFRAEADIEEAKKAFCLQFGTTMEELYGRYDVVFHLQTTAYTRPERFGKSGNKARFDSSNETDEVRRHEAAVSRAIEKDKRLWAVWKDHPWAVFLPANMGILGKINAIMGAIHLLLAKKGFPER